VPGVASVPLVARLAAVIKVMGFHDCPGTGGLGVQRRHQVAERLAGSDAPPASPVITPGDGDIATLQPPLQPAQYKASLPQHAGPRPEGSRSPPRPAFGQVVPCGRAAPVGSDARVVVAGEDGAWMWRLCGPRPPVARTGCI
jgi:hypothetical protein